MKLFYYIMKKLGYTHKYIVFETDWNDSEFPSKAIAKVPIDSPISKFDIRKQVKLPIFTYLKEGDYGTVSYTKNGSNGSNTITFFQDYAINSSGGIIKCFEKQNQHSS